MLLICMIMICCLVALEWAPGFNGKMCEMFHRVTTHTWIGNYSYSESYVTVIEDEISLLW